MIPKVSKPKIARVANTNQLLGLVDLDIAIGPLRLLRLADAIESILGADDEILLMDCIGSKDSAGQTRASDLYRG